MATPLAWDRVRITLTDERWVPLNHPDSNEALLRSLTGKSTPQPHIEGLYEAGMTPQAALPNVIARWPLPHVILLGMGKDGHIASLFPADEANQSQVFLAVTLQKDHWRMTLTPPTLRQANSVILAFTGKEKSATFEHALVEGAAAELPARHVLRVTGQVFIGP